MGLLSWLFGEADTLMPAGYTTLEERHAYDFEIVGESFYQDAIRAIVEAGDPPDRLLDALLIPEGNNPHDRNAVRVETQGRQVGYLSRTSAKTYRQEYGERVARCQVRVFGGGGKHYGVWLEASAQPDEEEENGIDDEE